MEPHALVMSSNHDEYKYFKGFYSTFDRTNVRSADTLRFSSFQILDAKTKIDESKLRQLRRTFGGARGHVYLGSIENLYITPHPRSLAHIMTDLLVPHCTNLHLACIDTTDDDELFVSAMDAAARSNWAERLPNLAICRDDRKQALSPRMNEALVRAVSSFTCLVTLGITLGEMDRDLLISLERALALIAGALRSFSFSSWKAYNKRLFNVFRPQCSLEWLSVKTPYPDVVNAAAIAVQAAPLRHLYLDMFEPSSAMDQKAWPHQLPTDGFLQSLDFGNQTFDNIACEDLGLLLSRNQTMLSLTNITLNELLVDAFQAYLNPNVQSMTIRSLQNTDLLERFLVNFTELRHLSIRFSFIPAAIRIDPGIALYLQQATSLNIRRYGWHAEELESVERLLPQLPRVRKIGLWGIPRGWFERLRNAPVRGCKVSFYLVPDDD